MRSLSVWLAVSSTALVLAGCGGGAPTERAAPPPRLPRALAERLASEADAVAASLAKGDLCAARTRTGSLQADAAAAAPRIPASLRAGLLDAVDRLAAELPACRPKPPPPPPPPKKKEDRHEPKHGHGKHKGHR